MIISKENEEIQKFFHILKKESKQKLDIPLVTVTYEIFKGMVNSQ